MFDPKKFTVFPGKIKVGPKCPIFIRGGGTLTNLINPLKSHFFRPLVRVVLGI